MEIIPNFILLFLGSLAILLIILILGAELMPKGTKFAANQISKWIKSWRGRG